MTRQHAFLAALVATVWGINFVAIDASLEQFPPLFLVGLRFLVIAIPTVLFIPRPQVPARWLVGYGLGFGTLQFVGLYLGMAAGFPAGLASLVLQSSAPFTVILGAVLLGERLSGRTMVGVAAAVVGLVVVGAARAGAGAWWPFALVILGGFGWALGNLASRQAQAPNPMRLTLWMSVIPPLPMFALSAVVEGPERIREAMLGSLSVAALPAWFGLAYTIVIGTVVGSGIWVWLMARYPAGVVAPFSMLVPIAGIGSAWVALGQRPTPVEIVGGVIVVVGVLWAARRPGTTPESAESEVAQEDGPRDFGDTEDHVSTVDMAARPARLTTMGTTTC